MPNPTPDLDRVTLKWAGVQLDGTPQAGSITLTYNGGVQLDDDATYPISIYPKGLTTTIETRTAEVADKNGVTHSVTFGYAEFQVPASNDPDIQGSGGTYRLSEGLLDGTGRAIDFVADIDAPGPIWVNRLSAVSPIPADPISAVTFADLEAAIDGIQPVVSYTQLQDVPSTFPPAAHTQDIASITGLTSALAAKFAIPAGTTSQYVRGDGSLSNLNAFSVGLGNVNNTSDANKPISTAQAAVNAAKADLVGGVVPTSQIPSLSIVDTSTVASQSAMLALTAQRGDVAVRSDLGKTFILQAEPATTLANWVELPSVGKVVSVNGQQGVVVLGAADVGAQPSDADLTAIAALTTTTFGRGLLEKASAADVRTAIGAGTSSLALGTTNATAKAGDYRPPLADLPAGDVIYQPYTDSARATSRTDIMVIVVGGTANPSWMLAIDIRFSAA